MSLFMRVFTAFGLGRFPCSMYRTPWCRIFQVSLHRRCQRLHFFLHHQLHRCQPGLTQQVADSLLQQAHDVRQRQHHLDVRILFGGESAELLHGSLLFDLVLSLHSDSLLFLGRTTHPRPIMAGGLRVATFYELPGILPPQLVQVGLT
jgi:hypothetical protein